MEQKQNKLILGCELSKYISKSRFTVILSEIWSRSKTGQFWDASFPTTYPNQGSPYEISMDFTGFQWISMDFEGFQWVLIDFDGVLSRPEQSNQPRPLPDGSPVGNGTHPKQAYLSRQLPRFRCVALVTPRRSARQRAHPHTPASH